MYKVFGLSFNHVTTNVFKNLRGVIGYRQGRRNIGRAEGAVKMLRAMETFEKQK